MTPLILPAKCDADAPYVTRLAERGKAQSEATQLVYCDPERSLWSGEHGLLEVASKGELLEGDIVLVEPQSGRIERLIRASSDHNTLLVTEQCDQLCIMCSQPPKKTHVDRFDHFLSACLLANQGTTIGISGGEPTLHLEKLLAMIERVVGQRPDLHFHVLTNAQHFDSGHVQRLRGPTYRNVVWGVPLYSADPVLHDRIVGKPGAYEKLLSAFQYLLISSARIELRTVLMNSNAAQLDALSAFIAGHLPQIEQWSVMGLENAGFARARFAELRFPIEERFDEIAPAINRAVLHGIPIRLFNVPLCHLPIEYRSLAVNSISDWKQRYASACSSCSIQRDCSGFFEWHPDELVEGVQPQ